MEASEVFGVKNSNRLLPMWNREQQLDRSEIRNCNYGNNSSELVRLARADIPKLSSALSGAGRVREKDEGKTLTTTIRKVFIPT